ncbi:hypothetical protein JM83_0490 [Gillisia sp. Hel_I_86]|uniref:glycosyltransferase family 2 protein n=1 Tax=Gillisia sp. Hel_I_86 TaxID=1249981 RepID=UPI00119B3953|nr:glycosyltransferase family 2 protein [Gillisia sp. Hel_I_86]TVZ25565.1 hypothetical protein JM83_0490 [Gillisia sp. Hel_I_86]
MLIIVHENSKIVVEIIRDNKAVSIVFLDLAKEFRRVVTAYPEELIIWIDKRFFKNLNINEIENVFHHDLIMASFSVNEQYFPETIGYIDQLPFINPNYNVPYPTWRMSANVGGIRSNVARSFLDLTRNNDDFGYIINGIAKVGQQNSLFCYSNPFLIKDLKATRNGNNSAPTTKLFKFVYQFYKTEWLFILLFCYIRYEFKFPVLAFINAFLNKKNFNREIILSDIKTKNIQRHSELNETIDVVIPTLKRTEYLKQVLIDLKDQSLCPTRVIVIEQDPEVGSNSQILELLEMQWPFEIIHRFVNKTGACMARNMALKEVRSKWIFFADDDLRMPPDVLKNALLEINRLDISALNLNCLQPAEVTTFNKIKQWGTFGSGTSIVAAEYALKCRFRKIYEHGFGEDTDFGLQLRSIGADIIYHPEIKITHLKAERGGFRETNNAPWELTEMIPKPSPTMMLLVLTHYTPWMIKGYKVSLFIKFYSKQSIKNPIKYIRLMERKWMYSRKLADKLLIESRRSQAIC